MIYIELFHGRKPGEELHDWGTQGPVFASTNFFHTTYGCEVKFGEDGDHILSVVGGADDTVSDCIYYDGMFYGDWTVFPEEVLERSEDLRARLSPFEKEKAKMSQRPRLPLVGVKD